MVESARVCQCVSGGAVMKLTNTVTNITKNNKGFSLLEVLVGVSIIGIISAIAVPTYVDYRNNAAKVASDTSAGNIAKAYKNCRVLNTACNNLGDLSMSCPSGATCAAGRAAGAFCAHIHKGDAGKDDFKVCVSITNAGNETRTYGGVLLNYNICHEACSETDTTKGGWAGTRAVSGAKRCDASSVVADCGASGVAGSCSSTATATKTYSCAAISANAGDCNITAGTCS